MLKLLKYLKPYRRECVISPLFKLFEAALELLVPLVIAAIIDNGVYAGDRGYVLRMGGLLIGLAALGFGCSIVAQRYAARAATGFAADVKSALFARIQRLSYTELDALSAPTLINRLTADMTQVQTGVNMTLRLLLRSPLVVFGAMIMAFTVDARAALVFAALIPLLGLAVWLIMRLTLPRHRTAQTRLDRALLKVRESLTGARVLRAFNKQDDEIARFREDSGALYASQLRAGRLSALMNPLTYALVNLALVALLWQGASRVQAGAIMSGAVVALVNYLSQILVELIKLANLIVTITKALASAGRVSAVLEDTGDGGAGSTANGAASAKKSGTADDGGAEGAANSAAGVTTTGTSASADGGDSSASIVIDGNAAGAPALQALPQVADPLSPVALRFTHVSAQYRGAGEPSLEDISFELPRGGVLGVIGGTGSGKSTLLNLIPRFYDASAGTVEVCGADVRAQDIGALRSFVGVVPQRATLVSGTIRDNLLWGAKGATDDELWRALETAQAAEIVRNKPLGLSEPIEQNGRNLSGGQRQRLTIARALVKRPAILILDDSASALDYATDAALRRALRDMEGDTSIVIASQRAGAVRFADTILVLDDGKAAGLGTHDELMRDCPVYAEIYYTQYPREAV